ncbi:MAG: flagellar hook-associated protein FlgK [Calditrichaeota bacterium]|nr:flagellar hook-associated protein FlgK [Calditrichota bacterium]
MSSVNATLALARRALLAQQAAMQVTGDNIANVNTPGYARKRAELRESLALAEQPGLLLGTGVDLDAVRTIRDRFVEQQVQRSMADAARYETAGQQLQLLEATLGDLGETGLSGVLDSFWNAWLDLARDPASLAPRTVLREAGRSISQTFRTAGQNLAQQASQLDEQIDYRIKRFNVLIAQLTQANMNALRSGVRELDDARARLLDELSSLAGVSYRMNETGSVILMLGNVMVVDGASYREMERTFDGQGANVFVIGGNQVVISSGEISGLVSMREDDLAHIRARLDELAITFVQAVNNIHQTGYGLDGSTGIYFFDPSVTGAFDIALSADVQRNCRCIAASLNGDRSDNEIALSIADLADAPLLDGQRTTIGDSLAALIAGIGARMNDNQMLAESTKLSLQQAESWRDSVSGVSIDEEMTNLIRYQNAFNAAAKLVTTVEKMMDVLLTIV